MKIRPLHLHSRVTGQKIGPATHKERQSINQPAVAKGTAGWNEAGIRRCSTAHFL